MQQRITLDARDHVRVVSIIYLVGGIAWLCGWWTSTAALESYAQLVPLIGALTSSVRGLNWGAWGGKAAASVQALGAALVVSEVVSPSDWEVWQPMFLTISLGIWQLVREIRGRWFCC
jgi:hypothetical protein